MDTSGKKFVVGLDIGYSNLKVTYGFSDESKFTTEIFQPLGYGKTLRRFCAGALRTQSLLASMVKSGNVFGPGKSQERETNSGYTQTAIYKALFL